MKSLTSICLLVFTACGGTTAGPDAGPPPPQRTCSQSITQTTRDRPPCDWEWTCSEFSGPAPQYAAACAAGAGSDVTCECREAGAVTGTMTLADGCLSFADACHAANAACGFAIPISCPE